MGHFCPPGSGSGSTDPIESGYGSGSATCFIYFCGSFFFALLYPDLDPQHGFFWITGGREGGGCNLFGSPPGKEAELRQVGVKAVDVHIEDVQVGVTAVVDEVAQVPVVRRVHLQAKLF